jgi:hypothetical protein
VSPIVALHATRVTCRDSIREHGLIAASPCHGRPFGVYVFSDYICNDRPSHSKMRDMESSGFDLNGQRIHWCADASQDIWQVSYIGRITTDRYVENAFILLDSVPPEYVTLVTGNN